MPGAAALPRAIVRDLSTAWQALWNPLAQAYGLTTYSKGGL